MPRHPRLSDAELLHAARAVFAEHGPLATTRQIAARAGVSKGTLHGRFGSKEALFLQAVTAVAPPWTVELPRMVGFGELRGNIESLGFVMLAWYRRVAPLVVAAWSMPATARAVDLAVLRGEPQLEVFFLEEAQIGRVRWSEPELAARALAGMLWDAALDARECDETAVVPMVAQLWGGLGRRPDEDPSPSSRPQPPAWPPHRARAA